MAKTTHRPVSRAKTADGLLAEIQRLIMAEPKRYNQHQTLVLRDQLEKNAVRYGYITTDGFLKHIEDGYLDVELKSRVEREMPHCGTIGCVAGWVVALKTARPSRVEDVLERAAKILGLHDDAANVLFDGTAAGYRNQQTAEGHAKAGAEHIARFRKRFRNVLRAKKV